MKKAPFQKSRRIFAVAWVAVAASTWIIACAPDLPGGGRSGVAGSGGSPNSSGNGGGPGSSSGGGGNSGGGKGGSGSAGGPKSTLLVPYVKKNVLLKSASSQMSLLPSFFIPDPGVDCSGYSSAACTSGSISLSGDFSNKCAQHLLGKYNVPGGEAMLRADLENMAVPTTQTLIFYRWGDKRFEEPRIGLDPPFEMQYVNNFGEMRAGKGWYLDITPSSSSNYVNNSYPGLITIVVPVGTLVLDITDHTVQQKILALAGPGVFNSNANLHMASSGYQGPNVAYDCNPRVAVIYKKKTHGNTNGQQWWAFKTHQSSSGQNIVAEEFDGKYLTTDELLGYSRTRAYGTPSKPLKGGSMKSSTAITYFTQSIQGTLSHRVYNPAQPNPSLPISQTASVPMRDWSSHPDLKSLKAEDYSTGHTVEYYWRYNGSCGAYYRGGDILEDDNVAISNCKKSYPTTFCRSSSWDCYEVVQGDQRIIVDKYAPGASCSGSFNCPSP